MAGVNEKKETDHPANQKGSREQPLDLPSLKVVQKYGIFSQDRLLAGGAVLADPTANREQVHLDDLSGYASSLRGDLSPRDSVSRSETLLQKRTPNSTGCVLLERPSNNRQHLINKQRDGFSEQETEIPESRVFGRSPAGKRKAQPGEGGKSPQASARFDMLEYEEFQQRMHQLHEKCSNMTSQEILLLGVCYVQNLARRERKFDVMNQKITDYFEDRKSRLLSLLGNF